MSTRIAEHARLAAAREGHAPWKKWGPYLSERQWGTVREDYSESGQAWDYFPHDHARSRAYRWGEDGLAGISDDKQRLCFAIALWNGQDSILKERLFGLTNREGNHGEDVKEYYFYLDNTPTHSYMKYLYKYPQRAYPYDLLVATGIFEGDRYFDVFVEYAKESPEEILIRVTVWNRGPDEAALHLLPTIWFRNTWSWSQGAPKPSLSTAAGPPGTSVVAATHPELGLRYLYCEGAAPLLFTENETNTRRIFGTPSGAPYVKDGINDYLLHGRADAVNPAGQGTKASALYEMTVPAGARAVARLRLSATAPDAPAAVFGGAFASVMSERQRDADEFYASITPAAVSEDEGRVLRQALAGMLWSKQYYLFDAYRWLREHDVDPHDARHRRVRNSEWFHMANDDVISMPDKWEYPWYAAWDLAFHTAALALVDIDFAKHQLGLILEPAYLHPNGQMPAYEWNFSDVNPPMHAWAALFVYRTEHRLHGRGDIDFLKRTFRKLLLNFTWWVNRKDQFGKNVFEGGFLGLDNIGVFDRSAALPTGGRLEQADATAWMALYAQNMAEMAAEIAAQDPGYEDFALKFSEHFFWIAVAANRVGRDGLWDEEDGFYYDLLRLPDGTGARLKVRSIVGLLPMCATTVVDSQTRETVPQTAKRLLERMEQMPQIKASLHPTGPGHLGVLERSISALVNPERLRRILTRILDPSEFLAPHGIRALSRYHLDHPFVLQVGGQEFQVGYLPAESDNAMFGGNSNWRGPIWFPINIMVIQALMQFYLYYGDGFRIECPTGSGRMMNLFQVSREIARRLTSIFLRDEHGRRPVYGGTEKFQSDPHWRDYILFHEYFHGENGAGLGASHQTGWTGLVASLIHLFGTLDAESSLAGGKGTAVTALKPAMEPLDPLLDLALDHHPEPTERSLIGVAEFRPRCSSTGFRLRHPPRRLGEPLTYPTCAAVGQWPCSAFSRIPLMNGPIGEILPLATHWTTIGLTLGIVDASSLSLAPIQRLRQSPHIARVLSSFDDAPKERATSATTAKSVGEHDAIRDLPV